MHLLQLIYNLLSPSTLPILIAIPLLIKYTIRFLTSPISCLPGPFYTSLSNLPIIYQDHVSNRTKWILKLHEQYGPIVRLSPSEVSVSSPDLIKEVFVSSAEGGGGYPKAPFFNIFQHFGARNQFSSIGSEDHSWRRRLVAGLYTQSVILRKEATKGRLWSLVGDFLDAVEREGVTVRLGNGSNVSERKGYGKAIDLHSFCTYYGTDGITSHIFPPGHSSTSLRGTKSHRSFIDSSGESPDEVITYFQMEYERLQRLYILTRNLVIKIGASLGFVKSSQHQKKQKGRTRLNIKGSGKKENFAEGDMYYGGSEIEDWGFKRFLETKDRVGKGIDEGVVAEILAKNVIEGEKKMASGNRVELPVGDDRGLRLFENEEKRYYRDDGGASECMDQFLAGRDTTGDTLSYIIHMLSLPSQATTQSTLRAEIQSLNLPKSHSEPLTQEQLSAIMKAPYLDAVIKETLRLYPASTTSLQRSVPPGGRTLNEFFIPENTVIGATPVATNTSPIFSSSHCSGKDNVWEWIPERWSIVEEGEEKVREMERRIWTFGSGGRGCIGKNLAILEIKLLVAGIYSRYGTEVDDGAEVFVMHDDWKKRTTFMDMPWFPDAKGVVRFVQL